MQDVDNLRRVPVHYQEIDTCSYGLGLAAGVNWIEKMLVLINPFL
jgi:hypothetical protein